MDRIPLFLFDIIIINHLTHQWKILFRDILTNKVIITVDSLLNYDLCDSICNIDEILNDITIGYNRIKKDKNKPFQFSSDYHKFSLECHSINMKELISILKCEYKFPFNTIDKGELYSRELIYVKNIKFSLYRRINFTDKYKNIYKKFNVIMDVYYSDIEYTDFKNTNDTDDSTSNDSNEHNLKKNIHGNIKYFSCSFCNRYHLFDNTFLELFFSENVKNNKNNIPIFCRYIDMLYSIDENNNSNTSISTNDSDSIIKNDSDFNSEDSTLIFDFDSDILPLNSNFNSNTITNNTTSNNITTNFNITNTTNDNLSNSSFISFINEFKFSYILYQEISEIQK